MLLSRVKYYPALTASFTLASPWFVPCLQFRELGLINPLMSRCSHLHKHLQSHRGKGFEEKCFIKNKLM